MNDAIERPGATDREHADRNSRDVFQVQQVGPHEWAEDPSDVGDRDPLRSCASGQTNHVMRTATSGETSPGIMMPTPCTGRATK